MPDYSHHKYEITVLADRIFRVNPFEGVEIEVADVKEMRKVYLDLSGGRTFAILLYAAKDFSTSEDARKLLASAEYTSTRFAAAFVTLTLANKILGNFFINFNKPATPTKLFIDEASAFKWLQEQKEVNDRTGI